MLAIQYLDLPLLSIKWVKWLQEWWRIEWILAIYFLFFSNETILSFIINLIYGQEYSSSINTWSSILRYAYMEARICHFNLRMIIPQKLMRTFLITPQLMFELLLMVMNNKLLWKRLSGIELVKNHSDAHTATWQLFFLSTLLSAYRGDDTYLSFVFKINSSYLEEAYHRNILISKSGSWLGWCKGSYIWKKYFWESFTMFQIIFKEFVLSTLLLQWDTG